MRKFFGVSALLIAFLLFVFSWGAVSGQASGKLSGSAVARNIGVIELQGEAQNGDTYGVEYVAVSGALSGYAWSPHIGWIQFDPAGPYPALPDSDSFSARVEGGVVKGWVRACSVFKIGCSGAIRPESENGGWDGWIQMSGKVLDDGSDYGVSVSGNNFSGWAWGSDVPGWIYVSGTAGAGGGNGGGNGGNNGGGSTLAVQLFADPQQGRAPLQVTLTAIASGSSGGALAYSFDCTNDGRFEVVNSPSDTTVCTYGAGNHTAFVRVEEAGATAATEASVSVRVLPGGPIEPPPF